jgi:FAD/FMN-containing dehydrogenase
MTRTAIDELRRTFGERVWTPGDAGYDAERTTFNATVRRRPEVIVRARSDGDVRAAILAAGNLGLPIAVRGGGHNVAGHAVADGALVVDLRDLRSVTVDPVRRTARVAGGAQWDDVDAAAWTHGLTVVGGTFGDTGVGGLTLGGGIGWLMGTQGLTCDNLVRAEVVTAGGELIVAGRDGDPELLWALRGGGGNFGVVTSFEFRLAAPGPISGGYLRYPIDATGQVLRQVANLAETAPDALSLFAMVSVHDEARAEGPSEARVGIGWTGDADELRQTIRPLREGLPLISDGVAPMTYPELQAMSGRLPFGLRHYWKGHFLRALDDDIIAGVVDSLVAPSGALGGILIEAIRGAARREPEGGAAFGQRQAAWNATGLAIWQDESDDVEEIAWARAVAERLAVGSFAGVGYANYAPADEPADRVRLAFGPERFDRLMAVKRRYDPDNRFRFNLNVPPGPAPATAG